MLHELFNIFIQKLLNIKKPFSLYRKKEYVNFFLFYQIIFINQ